MKNGTGISIVNSRALPDTRTFLDLDNVKDRRLFANYDVSGATNIIIPGNEPFDTQVGFQRTKKHN